MSFLSHPRTRLLGPMAWMTGVMNEEEYQKHCVRRRKCNAGDHVYGLGNPYWMRGHFAFVATVVPDILFFLKKKKTHHTIPRYNIQWYNIPYMRRGESEARLRLEGGRQWCENNFKN